MVYDLSTMEVVMQNDKFALYLVSLIKGNKYNGVRLDKRNNSQIEVIIEKTNEAYPPYRVIGFIRERQRGK